MKEKIIEEIEYDESKENDSYKNISIHLQKNIMFYIEKQSLPIGEYLSINKINNYLRQYIYK